MSLTEWLVVGGAALVPLTAVYRVRIYRLQRLLNQRTNLLIELIGATQGAVTTEEVSAAGSAAEHAVQGLHERGLGEWLDQEERRA